MTTTRLHRIASRKSTGLRRGAALVEFALVMPIMILVMLGMFELGRAVMVTEVLNHAARTGARNASITTGSTASAEGATNAVLTDANLNGATVTVLVNGEEVEVAGSVSGDEITVSVTIPYANVTWIGNPNYMAGRTLSGRCVMRRE